MGLPGFAAPPHEMRFMLLALWYHPILAILFGFVAIILMLVILLQRGRGVGLAGAFGGAGGQSAFGAKTGDMLTWATIVIAGVLLLLAVLLNYAFQPLRMGAITPPAVQAPAAQPEHPPAPTPSPATKPTTPAATAPASAPAPAPAPASENETKSETPASKPDSGG